MAGTFQGASSFNCNGGDLSRWRVYNNLRCTEYCFAGATSFNRELRGDWSRLRHTHWADYLNGLNVTMPGHVAMQGMFGTSGFNEWGPVILPPCPGSIEGLVNDSFGTPGGIDEDPDADY